MTNEALDAKLKEFRSKFVESAGFLLAIQEHYGKIAHEASLAAFGRLIDAHLLLTGVLGAILTRNNAKFRPIEDVSEERSALFASFIMGLETTESAIKQGRYIQAMALLRQEMETVAQLIAVRLGKKIEGKTPNISFLHKSITKLYGYLTAGAHVARHQVVRHATKWDLDGVELPGPTTGTRMFPEFDESLARPSFGLHLMLMLEALKEYSMDLERSDFDELTDEEHAALELAIDAMRAEGVVE